MENFMVARGKIRVIEMGTKDVWEYYENFLEELFKMVAIMKVPGRKAKSYEQCYFRTMFFDNLEKITIDGKTYDITNNTRVECNNCKEKIFEIYNYFDPDTLDM